MSVGQYLFSFSGRVNRAKIWLFFLIVFVFGCIAVGSVIAVIGTDTLIAVGNHQAEPSAIVTRLAAAGGVLAVLCLVYLVLLFCGLAVASKRLHDRNKSAWWLLVFFGIPFVLNIARYAMMMQALHAHGDLGMNPVGTLLGGAAAIINIWAFVELYCLRGTVGDNRYGPDPLAH